MRDMEEEKSDGKKFMIGFLIGIGIFMAILLGSKYFNG